MCVTSFLNSLLYQVHAMGITFIPPNKRKSKVFMCIYWLAFFLSLFYLYLFFLKMKIEKSSQNYPNKAVLTENYENMNKKYMYYKFELK